MGGREEERVGGAGGVLVLHDDGVLGVPEHQLAAVQGVRPDGRDSPAGGLQVQERGGSAAHRGAHQRLEGARPAAGAHRVGHDRGHVERPTRPAPQAADRVADRRPDSGGRAVPLLFRRVVRVAAADGRHAGGRARVHRRPADAVQRRQLVRGRHHGRTVAHRQVRRGRRRPGCGRHTGHARLRHRGGQHGLRVRVRAGRRPGTGHHSAHVRVRRRRKVYRCRAVRPIAAVQGRRSRRQPDGSVAQLLPSVGQTAQRPQHRRPMSGRLHLRATHVCPVGG